MEKETVKIRTEFIKLQDLLKCAGAVETGGDAKLIIQGRHDPCIVHRAVPVIEAACALAACQLLGN